jgi:signal transduction histidine kinase
VQLRVRTRRATLGIYGVLLVVPTLVFGFLYWKELRHDYELRLADVPINARGDADRIALGMRSRLDELLKTERERAFYEYANVLSPPLDAQGSELPLTPSPLLLTAPPEGVLAWFCFNWQDGLEGPVDVFPGAERQGLSQEQWIERLRPVVQRFRARMAEKDPVQRLFDVPGITTLDVPMSTVAVLLDWRGGLECLRDAYGTLRGRSVTMHVSEFRLEFFLDPGGAPVALATRRVLSTVEALKSVPAGADCLRRLGAGFILYQGFLLDVGWLFTQVPLSIASQVLRESEELVGAGGTPQFDPESSVLEAILPVPALGFDVERPEDANFGQLTVSVTTRRIREQWESQSRQFLAVAGMLVLTLGIGMTLLYKSVTRELENAQRMQNFVAAVTHELRTPLSTIRLHGEMLLDGWAADPEKQQEYYRRILRETERLSMLVERVLEKSRLKERGVVPQALDLNALVTEICADLAPAEGQAEGLVLDLAPGLPEVWSTPEAVVHIVMNLVENARKYAPVAPGGERLRLCTARRGPEVLLEVLDRGPGVSDEERERVFEAFYRVGSEVTRTTTGTGLGLHLVRLHAEATGGRAWVDERPGGGSAFRVTFRAVV